MKKKINAYQLTKVSSRLSKKFGVIHKGEEEKYAMSLFPFEMNLLLEHKRNPHTAERDAVEAIQLCLLTLEEHIYKVEYDLEPFFTPKNSDYYDALMKTFKSFIGEDTIQIVEFESQIDTLSDEDISVIVKCLVRIEKSINLWMKEMGRNGYFKFIERTLTPVLEKRV